MKKFLKTLTTMAYYTLYPLIILVMNSSHRSRAVIYSGNRILVTKTWLSQGKWGLPGGGINKNETPGQGLIREVLEETSIVLKPSQLKLVKTADYKHYGTRLKLSVFAIHLSEKPKTKLRWHEIYEAKWLDPRILNRHNASADLLFCLESLLQ